MSGIFLEGLSLDDDLCRPIQEELGGCFGGLLFVHWRHLFFWGGGKLLLLVPGFRVCRWLGSVLVGELPLDDDLCGQI